MKRKILLTLLLLSFSSFVYTQDEELVETIFEEDGQILNEDEIMKEINEATDYGDLDPELIEENNSENEIVDVKETTTTNSNLNDSAYIEKYDNNASDEININNIQYSKNLPAFLGNFGFAERNVNVRTKPTTNSDKLTQLKFKDMVEILGKVHSDDKSYPVWLEIKLPDGKIGYIAKGLIQERKIAWKEYLNKINITNKFITEALNNGDQIYYLDEYKALSKDKQSPKDKYGNRESQSIKAYVSTEKKETINVPDRSLIKIVGTENGLTKVKIDSFGGYYYLPSTKQLKPATDITKPVDRFIIIDRRSQSEMIIEKNGDKWDLITGSFVTTGKDDGLSSYETPYGSFLVAYGKRKMFYTRKRRGNEAITSENRVGDRTDIVLDGYADYAVRFSGGGYMHGIPASFGNREEKKKATAQKIGTYKYSHKCVRHYDDQIKFIYEWLGNSTPDDSRGYRKPIEPAIVTVF